MWCWGNSADGRLGNGALATEISSPVRAILSADTTVLGGEIVVLPGPQLIAQSIQAGELHTCAIDLTQHAYCWGGNPEGGVGIGELGPGNFRSLPVLVLTTELFKSVAVGGLHTCGITLGGGGRCWGYNVAGQLGDGGNASSAVPVTVGGFTFRTDGTIIFRSPDPDFPLPPDPSSRWLRPLVWYHHRQPGRLLGLEPERAVGRQRRSPTRTPPWWWQVGIPS